MPPEVLARMANQIAQYFAAYPDADAVEGVRDHLGKFWDPQMRRDLQQLVAEADRYTDGPLALHTLVVRAFSPTRSGLRA